MRGYDSQFERALICNRRSHRPHLDHHRPEWRCAPPKSAATLSLCPDADVPTRLREMVDEPARRIRRDATRAKVAFKYLSDR
jgi:hypothetical protein